MYLNVDLHNIYLTNLTRHRGCMAKLFSFDKFDVHPFGGPMNPIPGTFQWDLCLRTFQNCKSLQHVDNFHLGFHNSKPHSYTVSGTAPKWHVGHGMTVSLPFFSKSKRQRTFCRDMCKVNVHGLSFNQN